MLINLDPSENVFADSLIIINNNDDEFIFIFSLIWTTGQQSTSKMHYVLV